MSIVASLVEAYDSVKTEQLTTLSDAEAREFALARTHIEDAIMRVNLAFARKQGNYYISDVQAGTSFIPRT